jgi:hydrogenase maturation protease
MLLIIAYGNSLRSDDGAGLLLAEKLEQACRIRQIAVERLIVPQLWPELSPEIARADVSAVLFVDTRVILPQTISPGIKVQPISADSIAHTLGHHLEPAALLCYARLLYGKQPPAWLVTAPGVTFEHGERLSQVAQQALDLAQAPIAALLDELETSLTRVVA